MTSIPLRTFPKSVKSVRSVRKCKRLHDDDNDDDNSADEEIDDVKELFNNNDFYNKQVEVQNTEDLINYSDNKKEDNIIQGFPGTVIPVTRVIKGKEYESEDSES